MIVIGAGIAGLAAAQQMQQFGLEVIVLEARVTIALNLITHLNMCLESWVYVLYFFLFFFRIALVVVSQRFVNRRI